MHGPAEHTQKDEPTAQMPHDPESDDVRTAASKSLPAQDARLRLPAPSAPPQPPPPTGAPLTPETLRRRAYAGGAGPGPLPAGNPMPPDAGRAEFGSAPLPESGAEGGASGYGPHTARLLPVRDASAHRPAPRTVAAAVCLVLGVGLLGGAGAGMTLTGDSSEPASPEQVFERAGAMWHETPVDELFPRVLEGLGAGPGSADRKWVRVAVAPDSDCRNAFDPLLTKALSPVGCERLLRATYADETTSSVTTVGLVFTRSGQSGMRSLRKRFAVENLTERTDLMPRPYPARGTVAADFGDAQRASWTVRVLADAPVVVYAVTGFADGRVVSDPQAAAEATEKGETSAAAQAGLGHDAQGIADRIERRLRNTAAGRGGGDQ
ncbi:hypothetical protein GCM10012287_13130 [Streptomyces daqingensis]|uniref:Uncharacterized protein n=1 Tax=Streptomyces daqingensis TaxID=1472640 RepID=A0ABQ2M0B8_9ACTN|nr:hypothetical protein [Streptomyces daqingensis]GGO45373.1 hypothetical protein GCM10012287_13130 [Streptomyces daqingensis]